MPKVRTRLYWGRRNKSAPGEQGVLYIPSASLIVTKPYWETIPPGEGRRPAHFIRSIEITALHLGQERNVYREEDFHPPTETFIGFCQRHGSMSYQVNCYKSERDSLKTGSIAGFLLALEDRRMERPGKDVAYSSTVSPYAHGMKTNHEMDSNRRLLRPGLGKEYSSDPSPIAHPAIPIQWGVVEKELRVAGATHYAGQPAQIFKELSRVEEERILKVLGIPRERVVESKDGLLMLEIPTLEKHVPETADCLRYHSTNLAALRVALKFGAGCPPPRLAVGFSETKPQKATDSSPGLYFSESIGGSLMYAHARPYRIGVTLILQAEAGKVCSSTSNRVSYEPQNHVIREPSATSARARLSW